jgi:GntR family transcriptional regulator
VISKKNKINKNKRLGLLHIQIAKELKSDIESGIFANGDPFPSEMTLKAYYGVSRVTIRSALAMLQKEGLIERRKGSGTVVHSRAHHKILRRIVDFHSEAKMIGRKPSSHVLSIGPRKSRIRERILFDIAPNEVVIELRRLRCLDSVPVVLQISSHPEHILGGMTKSDLKDCSLYEFLRIKKGIVVQDAEQIIEPFSIDSEEARLLEIPQGTAVIRAYRTTRDTSGQVLELAENLIRGDYIKYTFRLSADEMD